MTAQDHVDRLAKGLADCADAWATAQRWGTELARRLPAGARLLVAGNGGSAAQAQHLSAEFVGRYQADRRPYSAVVLHGDASAVTAITNDYGADEVFARQVEAHGQVGDVCLLLSTSGRSSNLLCAAHRARARGLTVWAITGATPNPLSAAADDVLAIECANTATVQELHLVAAHLICETFDAAVAERPDAGPVTGRDADMKPLVIIGDVLLDVDVETSADRLVPGGPAPVLDERHRTERAGGAALAATFAADTYDEVTLIAPMATDAAGARIAELLDKRVRLIPVPATGRTPVKTRLLCGATTVARLDDGDRSLRIAEIPDAAARVMSEAAAVLVSDYGGGITSDAAVRSLIANRAGRIPVVWDPHPRGGAPVPGVSLVTPNQSEADRAAGVGSGTGIVRVRQQAFDLLERWRSQAVAITLGAEGALLVDRSQRCTVIPADPAGPGADACGAGDCLAGTVAGRLAQGELISAALQQAVASAAAFVAGGGAMAGRNRPLSTGSAEPPAELSPELSPEVLADSLRRRGQTVVATGGCFDLLHAGHVEMLAAARRLGDCLIVCLNSDTSVRRLKGPGRPLQPVEDRARVLRALRCVDAVAVFDEATPHNVLRRLQPHLWVKGDDYSVAELPELELVHSWGGDAVTVPYLAGRSTSGLVALTRR